MAGIPVPAIDPNEFAALNAAAHQYYAQTQPRLQASAKPKGNFFTHLLPTIGGIGGGAAGAAIGTALLPGFGTLAGALLGGALGGGEGQVVKNAKEGNSLTSGVGTQALEQGVLSAGPLRLLKGAKAAAGAVKAGSGIADALDAAGTAATAPGAISKALSGAANKMYAQSFTVPRRLAGSVQPEQTARDLIDYGISGSLDKVGAKTGNILKTLGGHFDNAVNGVNGQVKVGQLEQVANDALKGVNVSKGAKQALMSRITDIGSEGKLPGYANPSTVIDKIRELESRGYNYINAGEGGLVKNPDTADLGRAYVQVAKEMEDNLYKAIGSSGSLKAIQTPKVQTQLNKLAKGLGDKFVAAKSPDEVRGLMAPFVRAKNAVKLTQDEAQAAGTSAMSNLGSRLGGTAGGALLGGGILPGVGHAAGAVAGFLGAPLLRGTEDAARAPISTTSARILSKIAGNGNVHDVASIAKRSLPVGLAQALLSSSAQSLPSSANPQAMDSNPMMNMNSVQPDITSSLSQTPQDLSSPAAVDNSSSPFAPQNIEASVQKMAAEGASLKNINDFVTLASNINSLQQASAGPQLNSTTASQLASTSNALDTLGQLQQLYQQTGGGSGKVSGSIANTLGDIGLNNNAATYNALAESSVSQLARALNGGGQVSDKDAAVIVAALPKITDTPAVAKAKFQALMARLQAAQQNTLNFGAAATGGGGTNLTSALGGAYQ